METCLRWTFFGYDQSWLGWQKLFKIGMLNAISFIFKIQQHQGCFWNIITIFLCSLTWFYQLMYKFNKTYCWRETKSPWERFQKSNGVCFAGFWCGVYFTIIPSFTERRYRPFIILRIKQSLVGSYYLKNRKSLKYETLLSVHFPFNPNSKTILSGRKFIKTEAWGISINREHVLEMYKNF